MTTRKRKSRTSGRTNITSSKNVPNHRTKGPGSPADLSARSRITRHEKLRSSRGKRYAIGCAGAAVLVLIVLLIVTRSDSGSGQRSGIPVATPMISGPPGAEGVPLEQGTLLASAKSSSNGGIVDGIACDSSEQVAYHVHTHLSVYVDGRLRPIPAGIGIVSPVSQETKDGPFYSASRCYYWLHVHTRDGVIHIESPMQRIYTLGDFFDIWRQPLTPNRIASMRGNVMVFVNGHRYRGNPRKVQLGSHVDIQVDVGTPGVAPKRVGWAKTQL